MYCNVGLSNFNEHMNCLRDLVKLQLWFSISNRLSDDVRDTDLQNTV